MITTIAITSDIDDMPSHLFKFVKFIFWATRCLERMRKPGNFLNLQLAKKSVMYCDEFANHPKFEVEDQRFCHAVVLAMLVNNGNEK